MDPVSRVIAESERATPRLLPWVVVAAVLHGSVVGAAFLFGRAASARPAHLPAVSVKLIRPDRPPGRRSATTKPRPTVAAPTPRPTAAPTKVPRPQATAPPAPQVSEDAMAVPEAERSPVPTPTDDPPDESGSSGAGLSLGGGEGAQIPGIPADFHFSYYIERMLALIEARWYKPAVPEGTNALLRFRIHRDGHLDRIELEESSDVSSFDRAALRAMYAANPLPPLPPAYGKSTLTVHLRFSE